ncbi:MAG: UDP-N-acetylmuramate dehydrogenase [Oscillospiraceae bacterium]|nr:UDP-N-acetylmuramate dehydrogenase [Oscillospiraceae bacterium]
MNHINIISEISEYCKQKGCIVKKNESLKDYTSFKIGGTADLVVFPDNRENMTGLLKFIKENNINYVILGNGSNVLICENNFAGIVIITSQMNNIKIDIESENIYAECGISLNKTASTAKENSLSGLEFAYGIPGTLGGAVYMNAGAYGGQIGDVIYSSEYIDTQTLEIRTISAEQHEFAYRESFFSKNKDYIILSSVLKLKHGDIYEIENLMNANMSKRKTKQPLEYPSAGSVFKRGDGYYASKLIEDCGLKGFAVGGAQVSEKHAGFIVNKSGATFADVMNLIEHIKSVIFDKTGINIECEVRIIEF